MAHYSRPRRRDPWLRRGGLDAQHSGSLCCLLHLPYGSLCRLVLILALHDQDILLTRRVVNSVIIGWASSTLSQTKEKKAVVLAMTNVGGQIGYIYGAYLWPKSDEPRYAIGFGASAGFALLSILCAWWIRVLLVRENRRIRASTSENVNLYGY